MSAWAGQLDGDWYEVADADVYFGPHQPTRPWFSGSHLPVGRTAPEWAVAWAGSPNNSPSILQRYQ